MAQNAAQLHQKQVDVLRWIKDGCQDGIYTNGYEHRIIARALERRGLVAISGRGPTWTATITDAGIAWEAAPPEPVPSAESEADRLIERVLAANGQLLLVQDRAVETEHERLVRMSLKSSRRPRGRKLAMVSTGQYGYGPKQIMFVEHFDDFVDSVPVPVPRRVRSYHPSVRAYLDDKDWQFVTREHVARAARLLQSIAAEAPNRGIDVVVLRDVRRTVPDYQARRLDRAHLIVRTQRGLYGVQVREISGPGATKRDRPGWNHRRTGPSWLDNRGWEFISTGKLELIVDGPGTKYNGDRYRDAKGTSVEDRLPEVFRSWEIYRLQGEAEELARQRREEDRRRRWEAAMELARRRYFEQARWDHFVALSQAWQDARRHRQFLAAVNDAVGRLDDQDPVREHVREQLAVVERLLEESDAVHDPALLVPTIGEPNPADLQPFLGGWSPYGPER